MSEHRIAEPPHGDRYATTSATQGGDGHATTTGTAAHLHDAHRPLLLMAIAMVLLAIVCLGGVILDARVLTGAPIWLKPLKFSISLAIYTATLAVLVPWVRSPRAGWWARRAGDVVVLTSAVEMVAIVGQVIRGRTSHFDVATPVDAVVWGTMGTSITVLWVATAVIGVVLLRERSLPPVMARAVVLGFGVSLIGMAVAFLMTGPSGAQIAAAPTQGMPIVGAHAVGAPDGGPGLPLVGWSTTGGDLRIPHFVGLHALQVLPLLALGLSLLAARVPALRSVPVRVRLVTVAGAAWLGLTALLTWQALRAQPLIHPDALTLGTLAALVVVTALAAVLAVRPGRSVDVDGAA